MDRPEVEGDQYNPAELAFFRDVVSGVQTDQLAIDRGLDDALAKGWPLKRVEALMRAILRAAYYELRRGRTCRRASSITEYVDVAGAFFGPRRERHDQRRARRAGAPDPTRRLRGRGQGLNPFDTPIHTKGIVNHCVRTSMLYVKYRAS